MKRSMRRLGVDGSLTCPPLSPVERVRLTLIFEFVRRNPRHRVGRDAVTNRRIAWRQQETTWTREPRLARPEQAAFSLTAANRQDVAGGFASASKSTAGKTFSGLTCRRRDSASTNLSASGASKLCF